MLYYLSLLEQNFESMSHYSNDYIIMFSLHRHLHTKVPIFELRVVFDDRLPLLEDFREIEPYGKFYHHPQSL